MLAFEFKNRFQEQFARLRPGRSPRTVRFQVLFAVNVTLAALLLVFLGLEYRSEFSRRLADKHVALQEEAKTLLPAVLRLRQEGDEAVQEYLDGVCGRMRDADSPGHHMAVEFDDAVLQAQAHDRASSDMFQAMETAARSVEHRAPLGEEELVVGSARQEGVTVFVSEYLSNLRRELWREVAWHLAGITVLGLVAAAVVNAVLLRTVTRPLRRLLGTVTQIGKGRFVTRNGPFRSAEFSRLAQAVNTMSSSLAKAERERRIQMAKARQIQEHLLPRHVEVPGLRMTHLFRPADEVAGDYYDIFRLPDGTYLLCIADVVGHGIPAAMSAAMLKVLLREATARHTNPAEIVHQVNRHFLDVSLTGDFASLLVARWDPAGQMVEYASAGHGTAWLRTIDGTLRRLSATGLLLAVDREATWTTETFPVASGDRLLLATDGVTETSNSRGELFGPQRLTHLLGESDASPLEDLAEQIDQDITRHRGDEPPGDDLTVVLVEFAVPASFGVRKAGRRCEGGRIIPESGLQATALRVPECLQEGDEA